MRLHEPLLLPFVSVAAGVAIATKQQIPLREACLAGAAMVMLALISHFTRDKVDQDKSCGHRITFAASLAALVFAGMAIVAARPPQAPPKLSVRDNVPAIFEGCVVAPALVAADRERFTIELAPRARAQVSLSSRPAVSDANPSLSTGLFPDLPYGTHLEFQGKVRQTHNYNDAGAFDAVHYLARQKIYWAAAGDASNVHVLSGRCGNRIAGFIFAIRSTALNRLDQLYANDAYANGMMQATLIGATAKLDRMWTEDYRSTGTYHALVISGTHVAVLAAVFLFFLRICAVPRGASIVLTILAAWFYAGVTGWQEPVLRSASGISLFGIGRCFFREGRLLNILAAIALLFLVVDPEQLFDAGFQLSFMAVALIGAFVAPVLNATSGPLARGLGDLEDEKMDLRLPAKSSQYRVEMRLLIRTLELVLALPARFGRFVLVTIARCCFFFWDIFVTSFFLQLGLALPMIVYFHRTSISGMTANAIIVPLLGAVVPLGFLAVALKSPVLAHLCSWLLNAARIAVGFHARWEPDWRIPGPPFWLACLFITLLIVAAWRIRQSYGKWLRMIAWLGVAVTLAVIVVHPFAPAVDRENSS